MDIYEDTQYSLEALTPYGRNRLFLENEVRSLYPSSLIVRLPALFGLGIKKNFIYDIINYVPSMLKDSKYSELFNKQNRLGQFYTQDANGFYRLNDGTSKEGMDELRHMFKELEFSALCFTDSRSRFSFYCLDNLWKHIQALMNENITLAHLSCEPVSASELYQEIFGVSFVNEISRHPFDYSFFKTRYAQLLGGNNGYIFSSEQVVSKIAKFINEVEG
jgi:hypothetical protein